MTKMFKPHPGYWLFWLSAVYFALGMYCVFNGISTVYVELGWLVLLVLPFIVPTLGRWLNMSIDWDIIMFDWFKNKNKVGEASNIVPFPQPKASAYVEPPERPPTTFYRLGLTDNGRVSLQMGYSEITMNQSGIDNMIRQLELFRDQLVPDQDQDQE